MPADVPATPRRQTWREWQPPDMPEPKRFYTRDQILERIQRLGVDATLSDLRYWESLGVLPGPERRWHEGATRGLYPGWYIALVSFLRELQTLKFDLNHAGPILHDDARFLAGMLRDLPSQYNPDTDEGLQAILKTFVGSRVRHHASGTEWTPSRSLVLDLERLAHRQEQVTGVPTDRVEIRVVDAKGGEASFPVQIRPTNS